MTGRDGGIEFFCTGRHTHPVTAADRNEPTSVLGGGRKRNWTSPVTSRHEWRCPYAYPNGRPCGRTLRLGDRRARKLAAGLAASPGNRQVDISFVPLWGRSARAGPPVKRC
jgi:hypothetical protein